MGRALDLCWRVLVLAAVAAVATALLWAGRRLADERLAWFSGALAVAALALLAQALWLSPGGRTDASLGLPSPGWLQLVWQAAVPLFTLLALRCAGRRLRAIPTLAAAGAALAPAFGVVSPPALSLDEGGQSGLGHALRGGLALAWLAMTAVWIAAIRRRPTLLDALIAAALAAGTAELALRALAHDHCTAASWTA